jgi:hypothetical protein
MALRDVRYTGDRLKRSDKQEVPAKRVWHGYLMSYEDQDRVDAMFARALFDPQFCHQLVTQRDTTLLAPFGFTGETASWICSIKAESLTELAQAVTFN